MIILTHFVLIADFIDGNEMRDMHIIGAQLEACGHTTEYIAPRYNIEGVRNSLRAPTVMIFFVGGNAGATYWSFIVDWREGMAKTIFVFNTWYAGDHPSARFLKWMTIDALKTQPVVAEWDSGQFMNSAKVSAMNAHVQGRSALDYLAAYPDAVAGVAESSAEAAGKAICAGKFGAGSGQSEAVSSKSLLDGDYTFEEVIGEICNSADVQFLCKRSTAVVTDTESLMSEAMYLRENHPDVADKENYKLWQLEDGSYELNVNQFGFYNTVIVKYKNGEVKESFPDLVRVYGEIPITYEFPKDSKSTAIQKAKAFLAAHVRDFGMLIEADILLDNPIDIGDIVQLENPKTMRDKISENEGSNPDLYFVKGYSIECDDGPIRASLELTYGPENPDEPEIPAAGNNAVSSNGSGLEEVMAMAKNITYSGRCQTHDCVQQNQTGDCFGMSDFIYEEMLARGYTVRIVGYPTSVPEHRSVQYKKDGKWTPFPYREAGCQMLFNDTAGQWNPSRIVKDSSGGT